ncbi:TPA: hypothetical protein EYP27_07005 [Candidatus Bathyarchaeota archaeon]|nr:hypothetical protein [Candidatus Bathyarchaeota archaeon]
MGRWSLRFISQQQPVRVRLLKPVEERVEAGGVVKEPTPAGGKLKAPYSLRKHLLSWAMLNP